MYCKSNQICTTLEDLNSHYLENHPYKCPKGCDKLWKFRSSVRKHYKSHHTGSGSAASSCEHCLDIFATGADLQRHLATAHADQVQIGISRGMPVHYIWDLNTELEVRHQMVQYLNAI